MTELESLRYREAMRPMWNAQMKAFLKKHSNDAPICLESNKNWVEQIMDKFE